MNLSIHINPYGPGNIKDLKKGLGRIWVQYQGESYPEKNWDDFIIMVLAEWSSGFSLHFDRYSDSFIVPFIDGPFAVKIESTKSGEYFASFGDPDLLEAGKEVPLMTGIPVLLKPLIGQILEANRTLFDHFEKFNVKPNGLDNLRKWHLKLMIKEALL